VSDVDPGDHRVRLEKTDYETLDLTVHVESGATVDRGALPLVALAKPTTPPPSVPPASNPPPVPPVTVESGLSESAARDVAQRYVNFTQQRNVAGLVECYADPVDYHDEGFLGRTKLRASINAYFHDWPLLRHQCAQLDNRSHGRSRREDGDGKLPVPREEWFENFNRRGARRPDGETGWRRGIDYAVSTDGDRPEKELLKLLHLARLARTFVAAIPFAFATLAPAQSPKDTAPAAPTPQPSTPMAIPYTPAKRQDGRHVVALDIGHTVVQHGSTSARGEGEFAFNQRIVRLLAARLEKSMVVAPYVINPEGGKIALVDRAKVAAQQGAELFLSIHHDSANDKYLRTWEPNGDGKKQQYSDQFRGYGVFVSRKNRQADRSLQFALSLGSAMKSRGFVFAPHHHEPISGENRPILDEPAASTNTMT
jgi:N-acetylmuramoyl-L-alanine amidase